MISQKNFPFVLILLFFTLAALGCKKEGTWVQLPEAGTSVSSKSLAFQQLARDIEGDCASIGGCTCILDGMQTSCSIVFACLDAGLCELVATTD